MGGYLRRLFFSAASKKFISVKIKISSILTVSSLLIFQGNRYLTADVMSGGLFSVEAAQSGASAASRHLRDSVARGYGAMHSMGSICSDGKTGGGYELAAGFEQFRFEPETFRSATVTRTPPFAYGFSEDTVWDWEVPSVAGAAVTVDVYVRLSPEYAQGAQKPSVTLAGPGVDDSAQATAAAFSGWEKLSVSGAPSSPSVLILSIRGYSRAEGSKYFADDIKVSQ